MLTDFVSAGFDAPPPRRVGGKALYLDWDGVVHPSEVYVFKKRGPVLMNAPGHTLFEHCPLLEAELAPYPEVYVVLSTSWVVRYRGSVRWLANKMTPGLSARVAGATFHRRMDIDDFKSAYRGMQVWSDIVRRRPTDWLALDDDRLGWPSWTVDHLVLTDPMQGISQPCVLAELRSKLRERFGNNEP
jgi:hypothetical protein